MYVKVSKVGLKESQNNGWGKTQFFWQDDEEAIFCQIKAWIKSSGIYSLGLMKTSFHIHSSTFSCLPLLPK